MQKGFALVELIMVIVIVGFLALLVANLPSSISSISKSKHASMARDIASKEVDYLRKQTYDGLSNGSYPFTDAALSNLSGSTAIYEIEDCPPNICTSDLIKAKQVKVKITWNEVGESKSVELVTLVGLGGVGQ